MIFEYKVFLPIFIQTLRNNTSPLCHGCSRGIQDKGWVAQDLVPVSPLFINGNLPMP
jgi:hypothetical protein